MNFVPVLTSQAGMTLTGKNWQEAGVSTASCYLTDLLIKPGHDILMQCASLSDYMGWEGDVILNASTLTKNGKDGLYRLQSPFDGRKIVHSEEDIASLIHQLKPDYILLPKDFTLIDAAPYLAKSLHTQRGEKGCILQAVDDESASFFESDRPAFDAMQGRVYATDENFLITDDKWSQCFDALDSHCNCSTCNEQLTRAYLHHLFIHTPLLCQRFLIQHNVYYYRTFT